MNGSEQNLAGQVALVTGATSGIGLQTALALTAQGVKVVGTGRNQTKLGRLDQKIDLALTMDVTDPKSVQVVKAAVEDRYGRLDILVNNAGIGCFLNMD